MARARTVAEKEEEKREGKSVRMSKRRNFPDYSMISKTDLLRSLVETAPKIVRID